MPRTMLHEKRSHAGHGRQIRTIRIPRRKPYLQRQAQSQLHAPFCIHKPLGHYRTKSSMTRIRLRPAASFRCDESGRVTVRYVPTAYWVPNRHARSSKPSGSSQATRQQEIPSQSQFHQKQPRSTANRPYPSTSTRRLAVRTDRPAATRHDSFQLEPHTTPIGTREGGRRRSYQATHRELHERHGEGRTSESTLIQTAREMSSRRAAL